MSDWQSPADAGSIIKSALGVMPPVQSSPDLRRILEVPRRPPVRDPVRERALVALMTSRLRRERHEICSCAKYGRPCITELKPVQAWALYEAGIAGGILGVIGVGHGKTGLDILGPMVVPDCRVAVVLAPPGLRDQFFNDFLAWREHFHVPSLIMDDGRSVIMKGAPALHFVPFSKLSRPESSKLLESLRPDTFVVDEAHRLRRPESAATKRFIRYFAAHPETRCMAWSGTLTATTPIDYAHLSAFALRESSPLPLKPAVAMEWSTALDASPDPAPPGALLALCGPGESVTQGYHRRLVETRGVISTTSSPVDASINIYERRVKVPTEIEVLLRRLRSPDVEGGWTRPDGQEFSDILEVQACARQLACGFYYRWKFPRGEPEELIEEWFAKRKAWFKEVRTKLGRSLVDLDSVKLVANAAERFYAGYEGDLPVWEALTWPQWADIADRVQPAQDVVWVDDFLVEDAAAWMQSHCGIVWYAFGAFADRLARRTGAPVHAGGPDCGPRILTEDGSRSIIASIKAHGEGRDGLQHRFRTQLVANPPASGAAWDQLLGRLHRIGQTADEVEAFVYRHTEEYKRSIDSAVRKARYIQGNLGTDQKLLLATCDFAI